MTWVGRYRRMRDALLTIGTDCTSFTGRWTCVDDPGRRRDGEYGAERWCDQCIAREGLGSSAPRRPIEPIPRRR